MREREGERQRGPHDSIDKKNLGKPIKGDKTPGVQVCSCEEQFQLLSDSCMNNPQAVWCWCIEFIAAKGRG